MTTIATRDELISVVEASPAAVAAHDKNRWLALWAHNHVLEDPVGSRPVLGGLYDRRSGGRSGGPLARFWDTFIAANDIVFDAGRDFVAGNTVVRDLTITTTLPTGVRTATPVHLRYDVIDEGGRLKIRRMAAHWELAPVFAQLIRPTGPHVRALASSTGRMTRYLGVGGTARFLGAVHSVGAKGKASLAELVARGAAGDERALELFGGAVPGHLTKVIAAGDAVTASCVVRGGPAVLVATLNRRTFEVVEVDVFTNEFERNAR